MHNLIKRTYLIVYLILPMSLCHAFSIGSVGRVNGPVIHTTYFITPNNGSFPVRSVAYAGKYINGNCQYNAVYDLGTENLKTGDFVDIDGFRLKSVIGIYDCVTINYTYKQIVRDSFQLLFNGINYESTNPATSEVTIL